MLNKKPSPRRAKLEFKETVLSSFKFLAELGLHPVDEKMTFVRYESSKVFLNVYHGRASFELGVEIGRLDTPKDKLYLDDIVAWAGAEKTEGLGQHVMFQVSSQEGVREFVPKLAELVRKYAIRLLRPDRSAYDSAKEIQARRGHALMQEMKMRGVRSKAERAWHARDYVQVVELYGPVRGNLTEVEAKKLAYAEQQVLTAEGVGSHSPSQRRR